MALAVFTGCSKAAPGQLPVEIGPAAARAVGKGLVYLPCNARFAAVDSPKVQFAGLPAHEAKPRPTAAKKMSGGADYGLPLDVWAR